MSSFGENSFRKLEPVVETLWLAPTALVLTWSFPPREWTLLAWVALVPFGASLVKRRASIDLYAGAYFAGLAFTLLATDWVRTAQEGQGLSGPRATLWLLHAQLFAVLWPLCVWLGRGLRGRTGWPVVVLLPITWTSMEFLRMQASLLTGKTPFPWLQIGLTQAAHVHVAQIADLGGVWAVGLVIGIVNGAIVDCLIALGGTRRSRKRAGLSAAVGLAAIAATLLYGEFRLRATRTDDGPTVCLMPSYWSYRVPGLEAPLMQVNSLLQLDDSPLKRKVDLVLWDEDANVIVLDDENGESRKRTLDGLHELSKLLNAKVVVGLRRESSGRKFNSLAVIDPANGYEGCCDKNYLVPWSEFTPWQWFNANRPSRGMSHGKGLSTFAVASTTSRATSTFGTGICFDLCFSTFFWSRANEVAPDFFVIPGGEAFDETGCLARSMQSMAIFRAIENRRAIVRNADGGYSGMVDSAGRVVYSEGPRLNNPTILSTVPVDDRVTLVSRTGDLPLPVACLTCLVGVPLLAKRRWRRVPALDPRCAATVAGACGLTQVESGVGKSLRTCVPWE